MSTAMREIRLTQLLEGLRHSHTRRVYECEEQDVCSLLLVGIQSGLPVSGALEAFLEVISKKDVHSENFFGKP